MTLKKTYQTLKVYLNSFKMFNTGQLFSINRPLTRWHKTFLLSVVSNHIIYYGTPINLTYSWSFGSLAGISLVVQIISGLFLAMFYTPHVDLAFASIEFIMRDVNNGWFVRYVHSNGASMFFLVVYCHIFRGLYYNSYAQPRQLLWISGTILLLLMMATAFLGYVLPWGQMSFWGATVITSMFSAIPKAGKHIVEWLWGGFTVNNPTLNRFFAFHFFLPFVIVGVVFLHLALLHKEGSSAPLSDSTGVDQISFCQQCFDIFLSYSLKYKNKILFYFKTIKNWCYLLLISQFTKFFILGNLIFGVMVALVITDIQLNCNLYIWATLISNYVNFLFKLYSITSRISTEKHIIINLAISQELVTVVVLLLQFIIANTFDPDAPLSEEEAARRYRRSLFDSKDIFSGQGNDPKDGLTAPTTNTSNLIEEIEEEDSNITNSSSSIEEIKFVSVYPHKKYIFLMEGVPSPLSTRGVTSFGQTNSEMMENKSIPTTFDYSNDLVSLKVALEKLKVELESGDPMVKQKLDERVQQYMNSHQKREAGHS